MDGKELKFRLRTLLNEDDGSPFLDSKTAFLYIWDAVTEFVTRTSSLHADATLMTAADQTSYDLPADFLKIYTKDRDEQLFVLYNDGNSTSNIRWRDYGLIRYDNNTTSILRPSWFSVMDEVSLAAQITGTTTAAGAAVGGESTLTDPGADFSGVAAGDTVHNITDGSDGIVTVVTSDTVLKTAMFSGTGNDWTDSDSYIIQPQARMRLVFDPPPSTTSHTVTVPYIQRPNPVFSEYGAYRIQQRFLPAIIHYAAWLFKYRDAEPDTGDRWFSIFDREVRRYGHELNQTFNRRNISVVMKRSQSRSNSAR